MESVHQYWWMIKPPSPLIERPSSISAPPFSARVLIQSTLYISIISQDILSRNEFTYPTTSSMNIQVSGKYCLICPWLISSSSNSSSDCLNDLARTFTSVFLGSGKQIDKSKECERDLRIEEQYWSSSKSRARKKFRPVRDLNSWPLQCSTKRADMPTWSWSLCWFVIDPWSGESMTINIWKSCMWNADEEMNKEAIFTVMKTA